jgi:single-stranded DNA-binding protein
VAERLAQLKKGDSLSVAGPLKPTEYEKNGETKHGLSVTVNQILSVYDIKKRRPKDKEAPAHRQQPFNDDLPF